jgi:hypothetical protein
MRACPLTTWRLCAACMQQGEMVTSPEVISQVLMGLPLPEDGEGDLHANMLRMLGSLQDISAAGVRAIAAHTQLDATW